MKKPLKKSMIFIGAILLTVLISLAFMFFWDTKNPYETPSVLGCDFTVPAEEIPTFREIKIDFEHKFVDEKSLPLMGSAMIDMDGDGIDELFIGGGVDQGDALFRFENGAFKNISSEVKLPNKKYPTLGAVSYDLNNDDAVDLLICRRDGVYFYENKNGIFTSTKLDIPLNEKSAAATITLGDIDNDGDADMFLSAYIQRDLMEGITIFNDLQYGANSLLLKNNGDATFTDITKEQGLEYIHNTFQGVFADLDNDGWLDLTVAYDTGQPRTYRNNRGKGFINIKNPYSDVFSYPMGVAIGDYNNDGLLDLFFSNTGTSVPHFLAKGDLRKDQTLKTDWILLENQGDFRFIDVAKEAQVADFEFSWGAIFEDFNLDGRQDLVVSENYISFPPHSAFPLPCRFLIQRPGHTFAAVEEQAGVVNKNFGITPITSDFNNDGYPDLVHINIGGKPRAFINNGGNNHYLKVRFKEKSAQAGTRVIVKTASGKTLSDVYAIGEGLATDQTATLTFGLKNESEIASVTFVSPDGKETVIENPKADQVLEGI